MRPVPKSRTVIVLLAAFAFARCGDREKAEPVISVRALTNTTGQAAIVVQPVFPTPPTKNDPAADFDWETDLTLPAPAEQPAVPVPWAPTAKRAFPIQWASDYLRADGWELVYNSSSRQRVAASKFLVFYNKFRGVMRMYYYLNDDSGALPLNSTLASTLAIEGSYAGQSPLLNFSGQQIVDFTQNAAFASTLEPQPLSRFTWYATQVELTYDPLIRYQSYDKFSMRWTLASYAIAAGTLGGAPFSALPVGLRHVGTDFNGLPPSFSGPADLLVHGASSIDLLQNAGFNTDGLRRTLLDPINSDLLDGVVTQAAQTAGTTLKWSVPAQIVRGPSSLLISPALALPGYDNSWTSGVAVHYNEVPGVFNLLDSPVVKEQEQPGETYRYRYTLNIPSVRYTFNPATIGAATIRDIKQTLIAAAADDSSPTPMYYVGGTLEATAELRVVGVRVSFEVVPTNGSAPVRIIKTFKPTITK
ncbi:hypothetical protein [Hymenobacter actinosclerus]|uniref:Uncharacterized protein n=1 Tax=Hymenobacter actinosclerus TaxID=82805 RepID=A0A1I0FCR4_9BACT|nr:hypothetical protein [Hymenobacter actinosclerus]SET55857.1 hypothetical protein SAMN04487998_2212 [Hymenobacter actinosclerus]